MSHLLITSLKWLSIHLQRGTHIAVYLIHYNQFVIHTVLKQLTSKVQDNFLTNTEVFDFIGPDVLTDRPLSPFHNAPAMQPH